jgi:GH24 family phage-related lysozyme (muramidase)
MAKFKNIVGTGLLDYVQNQINQREQIVNKQTRTPSDLQWLSNRTGWFRLSSGVDFNPSPKPPITTLVGPGEGNEGPANLVETFNPEGYSDSLAKQYVLQGGTVSSNNPDVTLKQGFSETYTQGTDDQLGYKPMPGIIGVKVGTGGRWQTLMQADIDFICYDLDQLDIMTKLYMSLGTSLFLEWGHTPYVDNNGALQTNIRPINFFNFDDKDELLQAVTQKRQNTFGNYDGMVGTVYNFDWKANNDGSYNCSIKLMGPGGMLESLKINSSINIDFDAGKNVESEKYSSTLGNALYSLHNYLSKREDLFEIINPGGRTSNSGPDAGTLPTVISKFGKIGPNNFFDSKIIEKAGIVAKYISGEEDIKESWGNLLNDIYSSATYNRIHFEKGEGFSANVRYVGPREAFSLNKPKPLDNFSSYGNAYQLVMGLKSTEENDGLNTISTDFYSGYASKLKTDDGGEQISTYITLGHLFALIQHIGIFTETKESVILDIASPDTSTCKPIVYLDYHPDNTEILRGPLECSVDPTKCLIPWSISTIPEWFFAPLDLNTDYQPTWWGGLDRLGNKTKNFVENPTGNKVNPILGSSFEGKVFNILVNLKFAYTTLESLSNNEDKSVSLIEYVNAILDGINLSLGQVNNLRAFVGDDGKVLRIVDENVVEPLIPEKLLTIPNFGLKSTVYDYGFNSKITPKLASQIVIAAQARDTGGVKSFSEDVLSYQSMNVGIIDRFSTTKIPAVIAKSNSTADETGKTLKTYQKLYDHIYYCYSADEREDIGLKISSISNIINTFSSLQGINKKTSQKTAGTSLLPLEFNLTMDGIAGVLPYNAFLIPNNRLPKKYRNRVAFCVFSINHNLDDNRWTTTLRGQTILLDQPIYKNTRPTVKSTGEPVVPPIGTNIETDFPEVERQPPTVSIGNSDIPNSTFEYNALPDAPNQPVTLQPQTTPTAAQPIPDQDITAAANFIKPREGFRADPYPDPPNDPSGRLSIGYGSDTITRPDGSFYKITRKSKVTEADAERDLIRRIKDEFKPRVVQRLNSRSVNYDDLPLKLKVVFIDLAYNYGTLFFDFIEGYKASGVQGVIDELQRRANLGGSQVPSRRKAEIAYLGG